MTTPDNMESFAETLRSLVESYVVAQENGSAEIQEFSEIQKQTVFLMNCFFEKLFAWLCAELTRVKFQCVFIVKS